MTKICLFLADTRVSQHGVEAIASMDRIFNGIKIIAATASHSISVQINGESIPFVLMSDIARYDFDWLLVLGTKGDFVEISQRMMDLGVDERKIISEEIAGSPYFAAVQLSQWNISVEIFQAAMHAICFDSVPDEIEIAFSERGEYEEILQNHPEIYSYEWHLHEVYSRLPGKLGIYKGYCVCCGRMSDFLVHYLFSEKSVLKGWPAWPESVVCRRCSCNSRMRYAAHRLELMNLSPDTPIYIMEQVAPLYRAIKSKYVNMIGSEYLGPDKVGGQYYDGIRHEDAMNLSFADDSMQAVVSCDVFEHISDCQKGFAEVYRVLRPGGKLILTVPLFIDKDHTLVRAGLDSTGHIVHYETPVYHGNPLDPEAGSLAFYDYGWDIRAKIEAAGFSKVSFITYFSAGQGYFGMPLPVLIEAVK